MPIDDFSQCAFTLSHHRNHCYAAILIGTMDSFKWHLRNRVSNALVTILQVAFLSCTRMLTVMTSSLHHTMLKLNASSVPQSKPLEYASPSNFPIHCLIRWWHIYESMWKHRNYLPMPSIHSVSTLGGSAWCRCVLNAGNEALHAPLTNVKYKKLPTVKDRPYCCLLIVWLPSGSGWSQPLCQSSSPISYIELHNFTSERWVETGMSVH